MSYRLLLDNYERIPSSTRSYLLQVIDTLIKQLSDQLTYNSLVTFVNISFGPLICKKIKESCFSIIDNSLIAKDMDIVKQSIEYLFENFSDLYPELQQAEFKVIPEFDLIERIFLQFKDRNLKYHFLAFCSISTSNFTLSNYTIKEDDIFLSKKNLVEMLQPELLPYIKEKFFHLRITNPRLKKLYLREIYIEGFEEKNLNKIKSLIYDFTNFESNTYKSAISKTLNEINSLKEMMTTIDIEFIKHYNIRLITLLKEKILYILQDKELNLLLGQAREFILATIIDVLLKNLENLPFSQFLPNDINNIIINNKELFYLKDFIYNPLFKIVIGEKKTELELEVQTLAGISKVFEEKNCGEIYLQNLQLPSYSVLFNNRNFNFSEELFQLGYNGAINWLS